MTGRPSEADLEAWRRLSPWALAFIVVHRVQKMVRENLYLFLGAGAGSVFLDWLGPREVLIGLGAILALTVVGAVIEHRRFRFRLEGDGIRVRSGLFEQKELRVPLARVMNVGLSQPLYFRPLGLVKLTLETPGAITKEVDLPGISRALGEAVRERIAAVRVVERLSEPIEKGGATASDAGPTLIHQAAGRDLLLHGLASNQVWLLAGACFSLLGLMETRLWRLLDEGRVGELVRFWLGNGWSAVAILSLGALLVLLTASMLIAWVRFNGYTLSRIGDRFRSRCGLLETREQTVPRAKLLGFTLVQTGIGRLLGRWYLLGRQAGIVSAPDQERPGHFLVPGLDPARRDGVLASTEPGIGGVPEFERIDTSYRRVLWTRWLVVLLPLVVMLWASSPGSLGGGGGLLAVLALALGGVHLRWRWWGHRERGEVLWIRRGLLGQRIEFFPMHRVQRVELRQSPVQRRRGVANLVLTLPYGPLVIPFLPLGAATALADRVLWRVETSATYRL